jgi:RNA polymerase sigma-70 factor (ECF subfamily)
MREHGSALRRVVWGFTHASADAEDLYQTVALAIWRALPRFRGECSTRTYLFRIAHNCGITYRTKKRVETTAYVEMPDDAPPAGAVLDAHRERETLVASVRALPAGQRETMTLHLEGLSYREIGDVLGITEKTVSARLTRARQRLQRALGGGER